MKKIVYLFVMLTLTMVSCSDDEYEIDEAYEKAEITAIVLYNRDANVASNQVIINSEQGTIEVSLKAGESKSELKMTATISAGATLTPGMSVGYQDFSSTKAYTVTSPGGSVVKEWTITVL